MQSDLILQQPVTVARSELVLLFHGVGSSAEDLAPLGQALAAARPQSWVVSVQAPHPCDFGQGRQWFSVQGVTEANRPQRVAAAMPTLVDRVEAWQRHTGVGSERTTLVGFSQGAIMALESSQRAAPRIASRVVAIAGRFAQPPHRSPAGVAIHLLHGEQDPVMPITRALEAQRELSALGVSSKLDRFPGLGHGIDPRVVDSILRRWPNSDEEAAQGTPATSH